MRIIPPTMRHGKIILRHQAENISVLTQIREVRKLALQLKFWGELSAFLQNEIHETDYKKKIHENSWKSFLWNISPFFQTILYYPGFYSSLSDKYQRNGSIFNIRIVFAKCIKLNLSFDIHFRPSFIWDLRDISVILKRLPFLCYILLRELYRLKNREWFGKKY